MKITAGRSDRFVPETHTPLWISARKLEALLKTAPTPLFVYDEKSLVRAVQALFAAFSWEPWVFAALSGPDGSGSARAAHPARRGLRRALPRWARAAARRRLRLRRARGRLRAYARGCRGGAAGAGARSRLCAGRAAGPPGLRAGSGCAASAAAGAAAYKRPPDHGRAGEQRGDGGGGAVPPGGLSARGRHADAWPWYVARRSVHGRGLLPRRLRAAGGRPLRGCGRKRASRQRFSTLAAASASAAGRTARGRIFPPAPRPSGRRRAHCRRPCRGCSCP